MLFARRLSIAFAVTFTASVPLASQSAPVAALSNAQPAAASVPATQPAANADVAPPVALTPMTESEPVGVRAIALPAPTPVIAPPRAPERRSVAMMIVGGAVLIVGAVVGGEAGTIIMIGGGVVGIIGLIRFLQ